MIDNQDVDASQHIEYRHERHEASAEMCYAFHSADNHKAHDGCDHESGDEFAGIGCYKVGTDKAYVLRDGICLHRVADSESSDGSEDTEDHAQPFHAETALEGIHRTAHHASVGIAHAVFYGQKPFGILGCDAKHAGEPAPKHSPRAAQRYGSSHTDDVAGTDGGGQRSGERTKLAHVAASVGVFLY